MKNKLCYILIGLLVSFSFMGNVFAEEFSFTMSASVDKSEVDKIGDIATITVSLKSDTPFYGCEFSLEESGNIKLDSKSVHSDFTYTEGNKIAIEHQDPSGGDVKNGIQIFTLKYKVNDSGTVKIKNIKCTSAESIPTEASTSDISVDLGVRDLTNVTTLKSLSVTNGQMSPGFSSEQKTYTVALSSPKFSLSMVATNEEYQDNITVTDGEGNSLNPSNITFDNSGGQTTMKVIVKITGGSDDNYTEYILMLNYVQEELDNSLASLKVAGKEISLEKGKYEYKIEVDEDTKTFDVEATLADSENFQFKLGNEPGSFSMNGDVVTVPLIVEPKSNTTGAESVLYKISVVRKKDNSSTGGNTTNPGNNNPPSGTDDNGNVTNNQQTGEISMFVMAFILIASLIASIVLYQKNMASYNE